MYQENEFKFYSHNVGLSAAQPDNDACVGYQASTQLKPCVPGPKARGHTVRAQALSPTFAGRRPANALANRLAGSA